MQLRLLARSLEASRPSRERDELLGRTRLRLVEAEARDELGPPSSMPALAQEPTGLGAGWLRDSMRSRPADIRSRAPRRSR